MKSTKFCDCYTVKKSSVKNGNSVLESATSYKPLLAFVQHNINPTKNFPYNHISSIQKGIFHGLSNHF